MARLTITIASDNDTLVDPENYDLEVNEILKRLTARIYETTTIRQQGPIRDSNGNTVGEWSWIPGVTES